MKIEFYTENLSAVDIKMLAVLATDGETWPPAAAAQSRGDSSTAGVSSVKPPAAKKATPAKADPVKKAEQSEKQAAGEVAEAQMSPAEPVIEAAQPAEDGPTMADAVAAATQLVSAGEARKVKAALAEVGAPRVSEVPAESIAAFLALLS